MLRFSILPLGLLVLCGVPPAYSQEGRFLESHLGENGSGPFFARSAFAHGYRHGYEEGYHLGNLDVNMARLARTKKSQFGGLNLSYSSGFGAKKSFEEGFRAGVRAGYADGFAGRTFRAVASIRAIAAALTEISPGADSASEAFDRGVASGYSDGRERTEPATRASGTLDFRNVGCAQLTSREKELQAQESYCEGYRRGFVLGQGDALALRSEQRSLEASK